MEFLKQIQESANLQCEYEAIYTILHEHFNDILLEIDSNLLAEQDFEYEPPSTKYSITKSAGEERGRTHPTNRPKVNPTDGDGASIQIVVDPKVGSKRYTALVRPVDNNYVNLEVKAGGQRLITTSAIPVSFLTFVSRAGERNVFDISRAKKVFGLKDFKRSV